MGHARFSFGKKKKKNLVVDCLRDSTCNLYSMLWGSSYKDKNATRRFTSTKQGCAYFWQVVPIFQACMLVTSQTLA